jgi:CheY-like chemotaxis protein
MIEIDCRACSARFRAKVDLPLDEAVRVVCPSCRHQMTLRPAPAGPPGKRAMVADEPRPFRQFLARELESLGFVVTFAEDGKEAREKILTSRPDLAVLNVYLRGTLGVEISEEIRQHEELGHTRVVLIGALFRANRFRANPTNLYGADEYIEERIPAKDFRRIIHRLFPEMARGAEEPRFEIADHDTEEAKRLARLILSDIVIYNAEKADQGIRDDNFFDLLNSEIEEGRAYFRTRVPESIRESGVYDETLHQFVEMKREELTEVATGDDEH